MQKVLETTLLKGYCVHLDGRRPSRQTFYQPRGNRLDAQMQPPDIVRITVCRHSKRAAQSWQCVGGEGIPPRVPFVAARVITEHLIGDDLIALPIIADFEQCIAWAWLEHIGSDD